METEKVLDALGEEATFALWPLNPARPQERLDVAHWRMKEAVAQLPATVSLSDLADLVSTGRTPKQSNFYSFAFVSRGTAFVGRKALTDTQYGTETLQAVEDGDILVSGIDLVHGSVGVVGDDCQAAVVSKEYCILPAKKGVDPHWLVAMLRTPLVKRIIEGFVTGTSNRTRVESPEALMSLPVPPAPTTAAQKTSGDRLRQAHAHQRQVVTEVAEASRLALPESDTPSATDEVVDL
ncbi:restriction endonuclease subunit S domain-containing protein [Aureimonas psammosilenae]|uniref:hypothetical protein n=1 Tax=Aureimonas psammosilenae TaxID=2495496 RepID=UPI001261318C|nr:hypothetical protein [Aureimonas psammosilenae]